MALSKYCLHSVIMVATILFTSACANKPTTPASTGTVILLNGPSAVGKSSIIKAFQEKQSTVWLSAGIDNLYAAAIPPKFFLEDKPEHHAVIKVTTSNNKDGPVITMTFGHEGLKIVKGMNRAIAAYAHAGNNVVVDYIQHDPVWIADLKEALQGLRVIWVGVTASLESIQKREKNRGGQPEGIALGHYHTVHQGMTYDLVLNTDSLTPEQAAEQLIKFTKQESPLAPEAS